MLEKSKLLNEFVVKHNKCDYEDEFEFNYEETCTVKSSTINHDTIMMDEGPRFDNDDYKIIRVNSQAQVKTAFQSINRATTTTISKGIVSQQSEEKKSRLS